MYVRKKYTEKEIRQLPEYKRYRVTHWDTWCDNRTRSNKNYREKYRDRDAYSRKITHMINTKQLHRGRCCICGGTRQVECCSFIPNVNDPVWFCNRCHRAIHTLIRMAHGNKDKLIVRLIQMLS